MGVFVIRFLFFFLGLYVGCFRCGKGRCLEFMVYFLLEREVLEVGFFVGVIVFAVFGGRDVVGV